MLPMFLTSYDGRPGFDAESASWFSLDAIHESLRPAAMSYPGFSQWFDSRIRNSAGRAERAIFARVRGTDIVGIAIAKRNHYERKLCTLWVAPHARGIGLASELALSACLWLGTRKPLFTVPEPLIRDFRGLLSAWDFGRCQIVYDYYRPGVREFVFNGRLDAPATYATRDLSISLNPVMSAEPTV